VSLSPSKFYRKLNLPCGQPTLGRPKGQLAVALPQGINEAYQFIESDTHRRMVRGGHGLPKVLSGPPLARICSESFLGGTVNPAQFVDFFMGNMMVKNVFDSGSFRR
jgi:hypothetical protein